jgi:SAM-dependent methyltransferase
MTATNAWTAAGEHLATAYAQHTGSLRGAVRHALITRALLSHLPPNPQRIVDVGGGTGHQAIALARAGHTVTLLDPDPAMLERARAALAHQSDTVAARVTLHQVRGEDATALLGDEPFDLACCHGVTPYLTDPTPLLSALVKLIRPAGLISILAKNRQALAMRPGLEGRWADALAVIDHDSETGNLGVTSRADDINTVQRTLAAAGATTKTWYGVRVFTDHLGDAPVGEAFDQILNAEWIAGTRDPYRQIARMFHLITRRQT